MGNCKISNIKGLFFMKFEDNDQETEYQKSSTSFDSLMFKSISFAAIPFFVRYMYLTYNPNCDEKAILIMKIISAIYPLAGILVWIFVKDFNKIKYFAFIQIQFANIAVHLWIYPCESNLYNTGAFNVFAVVFSSNLRFGWIISYFSFPFLHIYANVFLIKVEFNLMELAGPVLILIVAFLFETLERINFSKIYDMNIEINHYKIIMKEHIDYPIYIVEKGEKSIIFSNNSANSIEKELILKFSNIKNFLINTISNDEAFRRNENLTNRNFIEITVENQLNCFKPVLKTFKWVDKKLVMLIILINITSEKLILKAQEEASHFKDTLLSSISHDLRTPLNASINLIQICLSIVKDHHIRSLLSNALESNQLLLAIVNDLLDFSQMNANTINIRKEIFPISELIDQLKIIFQNSMKDKMLDYKFVTSNFSLIIFTDKIRLERVLINLIANAQKYTRRGFILVKIQEYQDEIIFSVEDSGIGISEDCISKLFKFNSENISNNMNSHGIGLGLTIANKIIEKLSGNNSGIKCSSEIDKGSIFSFSLQMQKSPSIDLNSYSNSVSSPLIPRRIQKGRFLSVHIESESSKDRNSDGILSNSRILVIEDEQTSITAIEAIFNLLNVKAIYAYNGKEALEIISENKLRNDYFDLILSDINMPIMNGFQFAKIFKETYPLYYENCYLVACSANSSNTKKYYLDSGFDHYLEKPINMKSIQKLIKEL